MHFAVSHFTITPPKDFLEIRGNIPAICRSATHSLWIEIRRAFPQPGSRRCHSTVREIVQRNGMAQASFRVAFEEAQQTMQFRIPYPRKLLVPTFNLPLSPIFRAVEPSTTSTNAGHGTNCIRQCL